MTSTSDRKPVLSGDEIPQRTGLVSVLLFLVPPVAWVLSLGLSYLVEDFACSAAASAGAAAPITAIRTTILVLNVLLLLATAIAGILAVRLRRGRSVGHPTVRFLGWGTIASALVFGYGIVLIIVSALLLGTCS